MVLDLLGAVAALILSTGIIGLMMIFFGVLMVLLGGLMLIPFLLVVKGLMRAGGWLRNKLF